MQVRQGAPLRPPAHVSAAHARVQSVPAAAAAVPRAAVSRQSAPPATILAHAQYAVVVGAAAAGRTLHVQFGFEDCVAREGVAHVTYAPPRLHSARPCALATAAKHQYSQYDTMGVIPEKVPQSPAVPVQSHVRCPHLQAAQAGDKPVSAIDMMYKISAHEKKGKSKQVQN